MDVQTSYPEWIQYEQGKLNQKGLTKHQKVTTLLEPCTRNEPEACDLFSLLHFQSTSPSWESRTFAHCSVQHFPLFLKQITVYKNTGRKWGIKRWEILYLPSETFSVFDWQIVRTLTCSNDQRALWFIDTRHIYWCVQNYGSLKSSPPLQSANDPWWPENKQLYLRKIPASKGPIQMTRLTTQEPIIQGSNSNDILVRKSYTWNPMCKRSPLW